MSRVIPVTGALVAMLAGAPGAVAQVTSNPDTAKPPWHAPNTTFGNGASADTAYIRQALREFAAEWQGRGIAFVGINSNDATAYPDDSPEKMAEEKRSVGYTFPYLFDQDQSVARAYRAACTPDFYVFDRDRTLAYRGQFDDSRPGNDIPPTGRDVAAALTAILNGEPAPSGQRASIGCNIKWKPGRG